MSLTFTLTKKKMKNFKKKTLNVMSVNSLTLVLAIIFLTIGFNIQERFSFWGTFITEVVIVLIPALLISSTGRIKEVLKLKKVPMKSLGLTIILVILIYPVILLFNGVFLSLLSNFIEYKNFPMELMLQNVPIFNYLIFKKVLLHTTSKRGPPPVVHSVLPPFRTQWDMFRRLIRSFESVSVKFTFKSLY